MPHAQLCYKDFVQHLYNMCPQQVKQLNSTAYDSRQTASRGLAEAGIMVGKEHVGRQASYHLADQTGRHASGRVTPYLQPPVFLDYSHLLSCHLGQIV